MIKVKDEYGIGKRIRTCFWLVEECENCLKYNEVIKDQSLDVNFCVRNEKIRNTNLIMHLIRQN